MRILYATDLCGVHDVRLVRQMREAGHEVLALSFRDDLDRKEFRESGWDITAIPGVAIDNRRDLPLPSAINGLKRIAHFKRTYRAWKPDIVHAVWVNRMGFIAAAARAFPLAVMAAGSDVFIDPFESRRLMFLTRYVAKRAQAVWHNSYAMRDAFVETTGRPETNHVFYWGIDPERFPPAEDDTGAKEALRWSGRKVLMQNRTFRPVYGYEYVFEAVVKLKERFDNILLAAGGVGPQEEALRALAKRLDIEDNVTWPGYVDPATTLRMLHAADVYVSASLSDSSSASLLEAVSAGKAIVTTRVGGNVEWVEDGENGLSVEPRDSEGLCAAVGRLLEDGELRRRFERENADHRRPTTDFRLYFPQLMWLYERLAAEWGR